MNEAITKQMSNIVADVMTSFQSDFEKYDKEYVESAKSNQFPMIWIVGKSHTYLLKLGSYKEKFFENESVRLLYAQGDNGFDSYLKMFADDHVFLIEEEKVVQVSVEQAKNAVSDYVIPTVKEWESQNGKLPKKCKVKVKFSNIAISKLKEMIRDCEAHNDTSLLDALKGFHRYRQISSDHHILVSYNSYYNEFTFCEYTKNNPGLVGGIIFHGWADSGYQENYAVQLTPRYGWSKHT